MHDKTAYRKKFNNKNTQKNMRFDSFADFCCQSKCYVKKFKEWKEDGNGEDNEQRDEEEQKEDEKKMTMKKRNGGNVCGADLGESF